MTGPKDSHAIERGKAVENAMKDTFRPLYWSALREPTVLLIGSLNERPDIATAAILGYN
ncbi:hypothetical protein SB861_03095 [Paraburkholderia sp. SIMBA_049]